MLSGRAGSDILWGDWDPVGQPESQNDLIFGGDGNDFIYGSHGRNVINAGKGNDAISVHYGRGIVDCGPGRDIYHVPKTLQEGLQGQELREGRPPLRAPARRRAEAAALAAALRRRGAAAQRPRCTKP